MKCVRYILVAMILVGCTIGSAAQQVKLTAMVTDSGVHLRWIGNTDPRVTGWNVERSTDGAAYALLTPVPLPFVTNYLQMKQYVGRYKAMYFLTLFGVSEERDLTTEDIENTLTSTAVGIHLALRAAEPEVAILSGEYYFDPTVPTGSVTYRVTSVGAAGKPVQAEVTVDATQSNSTLSKPSNISVSGLEGSVQLLWTLNKQTAADAGIVGFRIWKGAKAVGPFTEATTQTSMPLFTSVNDTGTYSWSDNIVESADTAYYYICYVHATGVLSSRSNIIRAVVGADDTPALPLHLTAVSFGMVVKLSWQWSDRGAVPQKVVMWCACSDSADRVQSLSAADTTFIDVLANPGSICKYALFAYSTTDSISSDTVSFVLTDIVSPQAPTSLKARADTGAIHLSWQRSASEDVAGYVVMVAADSRLRNFMQLQSALIADTSIVDSIPHLAESTLAYKVIAQDRAGNNSEPSIPVVVHPIDVMPPAPSQITQCIRTDSIVLLKFTSSVSADVAGYVVERRSGSAWKQVHMSIGTTVSDTLPAPGDYEYRVLVADSAKNHSAPSATRGISWTTELSAPAPVTVSVLDFAIELRWNAVKGAAGYQITRVQETGERMIVDNVGATISQWLDYHANPDQSFTYEVVARTNNWHLGKPSSVNYKPGK